MNGSTTWFAEVELLTDWGDFGFKAGDETLGDDEAVGPVPPATRFASLRSSPPRP